MKSAPLLLGTILLSSLLVGSAWAQTPAVPVPATAQARIAVTQLLLAPERPDWTYQPGEAARFRLSVRWDRQAVGGVTVKYNVGPEMLPAEEKTAVVPPEGLWIDGGTLAQPGFVRCIATAEVGGKPYRAVATAGFAPEKIQPTQAEPADFDAFWRDNLAALAKVPLDARLTLLPDACTATVNVYHVSFQTWGYTASPTRFYGIYCEPKAPGKYPALLRVPGAGVRPYVGMKDLAEKGALVMEVGIHGIPVNQPQEVYDALGSGALQGYMLNQLDNRDNYYYRRVYLGCVRAGDFLTSRGNWDGRNYVVFGGSQGGQLSLVTAALDRRVTALSATYPAYCDVTGYLHGRAGGWPHMMREESAGHRTPAKLATTSYYDAVNFARRVKAPGFYTWGYNDETCPPTSMFAAYNVISAPRELLLALETGHNTTTEQWERIVAWMFRQVGPAAP